MEEQGVIERVVDWDEEVEGTGSKVDWRCRG